MTTKPKILVQFDPDPQASLFDAVVAVDAGVDQLLQYAGVIPAQVQGLVHGAIFTRGPADLHHTAIFVGGSDVQAGERLLAEIRNSYFGPLRVSVMLDSNGANTTASAAVVAASRHLSLAGATALVLAGTGPVGQRVAHLLAREGATVRVASRQLDRAREACEQLRQGNVEAAVLAVQTASPDELLAAAGDAELIVAAGAAGVELLPADVRGRCARLKVAVDLNAVPPLGIGGLQVHDKGQDYQGVICYGAVGVGGTKMKIHRAAIQQLFTTNDRVLDVDEIFAIGKSLEGKEFGISRHA